MIRDHLIAAIKGSFPNLPFSFSASSTLVATLPAPFAEIGALEIYDDGGEAAVSISGVTHGHFSSYDSALSVEQREQEIVENVISFLQGLFDDKVLLFRTPGGGIGGWYRLDLSPEPPTFDSGREYFLWSGPYRTKGDL